MIGGYSKEAEDRKIGMGVDVCKESLLLSDRILHLERIAVSGSALGCGP